ncbi:protein disulfide isomerase-like 1-4 [Impatiens glandulifera]|uniref:protein disulfide isomerase-like 1-4 n=1 Tax=Impatiens glandulifera TaxID=253017 RepID=UPI001FB0F0BE|nr:protein disulfide isomerase-like 1-4 [Impatiens glandulifera]
MANRLLQLSIFTLLIISITFSHAISKESNTDDLDEDLSFLELDDDEDSEVHSHSPLHTDPHNSDVDDDADYDDADFENYDDFEVPPSLDHELINVDEKDVVVLKERNFSDFIENHRYVMVEFYAPWCGHCQSLAPEYAAAATELMGEEVKLAKVDATEENDLAEEYEVQGFPTVYFFIDGEHMTYTSQRTKEAIVTWIKKKIGPGVYNLTTIKDAERVLTSESKVVVGFLDSLVGPESEELAAASKLADDVNFYQTTIPDVATVFHIDTNSKRPGLVLLKEEAEKLSYFDGNFTKSEIAEFVIANKIPLVTIFSKESAPMIFESSIKKQILLFAPLNESEKVIQTFEDVAKSFKGKLIFVYVDIDNEEVGKPVADYFGITGNAPKIIGYAVNDEARKFVFDGEVAVGTIKDFAANFLGDKLKPFYKSDPIPVNNVGNVKVVVGNNFDEIVLDESKDVLLELYAPWCGHCQALEPTFNKLAKHLSEIDSLVIAKMDGTTNEHPRAKAEGFPRSFLSSWKQEFRSIVVDAERTVVSLYKFIKKHASKQFKLPRPESTSKPDINPKDIVTSNDAKDEL